MTCELRRVSSGWREGVVLEFSFVWPPDILLRCMRRGILARRPYTNDFIENFTASDEAVGAVLRRGRDDFASAP